MPSAHDHLDSRMLVLSISGSKSTDELRRLVAQGAIPDPIFAADAFAAESLDDGDLARVGGLRGRLLGRLPAPIALAIAGWRRREEFDVVLSWGEHVAFPLAFLLALTPRRRARHMAILMWPFNANEPSAVRRLLKRTAYRLLARSRIDRLCIPAPRQRRLAVERWGIPNGRLVEALWPVDTGFWHPIAGAGDMICAVGSEMRDYPTLLEALGALDVPCHIARGVNFLNPMSTVDGAGAAGIEGHPLPANVTVGPKSSAELRELYARSRIVVIPLQATDSDNGVTVVTEAMAMGRAIVATATEGRAEVLRDGVNCVLVTPHDPLALRDAIVELWNNPARCERLGAAGREAIVPAHGIDQWVGAIRAAAAELTLAARSS
jgi:glycosyltransferase involved in cell wall biosynthesis